MSKRNLNEILGFISRWGDSDFSLVLMENAPLQMIMKRYEQAKKMGASPEILKKYEDLISKREEQSKAQDEDKLNKEFMKTELLPSLRKKGQLLPGEEAQFKKDWEEAQRKQQATKPQAGTQTQQATKPQAGTQTQQATKPQAGTKPGTFSQFLGVLHPSRAGQKGSLGQLGGEIRSGASRVGDVLGNIPGVLTKGHALGRLIGAPGIDAGDISALLGSRMPAGYRYRQNDIARILRNIK